MGRSVLYVTDYPNGAVSGYAGIAKALCTRLVKDGYDVKVVGIGNRGEEHWENFSIIPAETLQEAQAAIHNLSHLWKPEVLITAMDIPMQIRLMQSLKHKNYKHFAITPMENGPLCKTWALGLFPLDHIMFISKLGEMEARKAGLQKVSHIQMGVNVDEWYPAKTGEREIARNKLGFEPDEKLVLTVADNQERKNLSAAMEIIAKLKERHPEQKLKYVLVTRAGSQAGWKLRDLADTLGIVNEYVEYERGIPQKQLRLLYLISDAYLQTSKAEGYGLPVLEAMSMGLPVVATNTGAMTELLMDNRGYLVPPAFTFTDVWGNSKRDMIDIDVAADVLWDALDSNNPQVIRTCLNCLDYAKHLTWDIGAEHLKNVIEEVC